MTNPAKSGAVDGALAPRSQTRAEPSSDPTMKVEEERGLSAENQALIESVRQPGESSVFPSYINRLLNAARASRPDGGLEAWRPIETAPRDGTWFLAYSTECASIGEAAWDTQRGVWKLPYSGVTTCVFTHWMPLPAPPLSASPTPVVEGEDTRSQSCRAGVGPADLTGPEGGAS